MSANTAPEKKNPFLQLHPSREKASESDAFDFTSVPDNSMPQLDIEHQLQNIMDCILPPLEWNDADNFWKQKTSTTPVTRMDMAALEDQFECELKNRSAKPFGICPIRRQLYDQIFDELIRQTTVSCCERGLLLVRVRDEIRMTILAYQSLLESAIAYGLRKAVTVENQQTRAEVERDEERAKNKAMHLKVAQLERRLATDKQMAEEELEILEQKSKEENQRLLEANKALKNQLQAILQMESLPNK